MPAATGPTTTVTPSLPAVCRVRGWRVFGPGYHKGTLYTPDDCKRLAANYARLREVLPPSAKLGHDSQQRLKKSLGFLNLGTVVGVEADPHGNVSIDVDGVPTAVGAEGNAGRLNSGSVELLPKFADPDDPAREIPGPVLTGVAFLGEEQPAVKGFPPPVFEFEDGTPVPPSLDPAPWLAAQAEVARAALNDPPAAPPTVSVGGRQYTATVICFSEMSPMNPEELKAKLEAAGLPPDVVAKCLDACGAGGAGGDAAAAGGAGGTDAAGGKMGDLVVKHEDDDKGGKPDFMGMCQKYAADPAATPEQKLFAALAKKFSEENDTLKKEMSALTKRFGAVEAAAADEQKKKDEAQMAAFSDQVERACKPLARKVSPDQIQKVVKPHAMGILTSKAFSAEADRVKAFSDFFDGWAALPDNPLLADVIDDGKPRGFQQTPEAAQMLKHLKVTNPRVVERLTAASKN